MLINPQPKNRRRPNRISRHRRRRRGSILIMVVALLTLMALIGTALIATARTDRYTTRAYADSVTKDTTRQQFLDQAATMVEDVLKNDQTPTLDSPRYDTWLADRLPSPLPGNPTKPVWKYITGRLTTKTTPVATDFPTVADYAPPFQVTYGSTVSPAADPPANSDIKMKPELATALTATGPFFLAGPTSISITYPSTHPEESVRNQTRTYPALTFYDNTGAPADSGRIYLAGDADGDGIADSVLVRLSPTPINGVTYYAAVRIIDNNSAVNVNTAWSRDHDFNATGGQVNPNGFFPAGVGLYELLSRNTDATTSRVDRDNEIAELNEYRFGYPKDTTPTGANWTDSFSDYTTSTQAVNASLSPIEDADNDPTSGNGNLPTARTDFTFTTQGEALSMQLGRRIDNPSYNTDPAYTPTATTFFPTPAAGTPFNYRGYSLTDASTAALAYRFCMVNPDNTPSDLEIRLRKSIYESAPNYTDYPHAGKLPGWGFSGDSKVQHWNAFPANEADLWFQYLNYTSVDNTVEANDPANTQFTPTRAAGPSGPALTGPTQFRSVRPLLTTYSATSNLVPAAYRWTNSLYAWNHGAVGSNSTDIYPGMLPSDMSNVAVTIWGSGGTHKMYDMVKDPTNGLTYMRISDAPGDMQPSLDTTFQYWEPQPLVTGHAKTNINLAGFPELWRAFYSTMYNGIGVTSTADGGTPVDQAYMTEVGTWTGTAPSTMSQAFFPNPTGTALQAYDIYRGMHWVENYGTPPADPTFPPKLDPISGLNEVNTLRMFRSTIRDPRATSPYPPAGLHRLTPYQMMALRSAIAAVNTKQLLSPTKNTTVVSRSITLYDVDPASTNGAPDPAVGGTPAPNNPVPQYEVTVYGNAPQPYITEVFASNDTYQYTYTDAGGTTYTASNPKGYVAIELYNPYDTAISLDDFTLLSLPRGSTTYTGTGTDVSTTTTPGGIIKTFPAGSGYSIPAHGYVILEGMDTTNADSYRPPAAQIAGGAIAVPVPELTKLIGSDGYTAGELVLLRPVTYGTATPNVWDKVPVDQFDFTNFPAPTAGATQMTSWHYARSTNGWQFVYPGRYDASSTSTYPRHQGVHQTPSAASPPVAGDHTYTPNSDLAATVVDPWTPTDFSTLPQPFQGLVQYGTKAYTPVTENPAVTLGGANVNATYCIATLGDIAASIQLANVDMPGRNPVTTAANAFPFGGFARDGDILQVPYIGSYRIRRLQADPAIPAGSIDRGALVGTPQTVLEFNSVTMDAAFAEDTDATNNTGGLAQENVGRFTPVTVPATVYDWTKNLYTYLTTQGAPLDYLPDTSPYVYPPGVADPHKLPKPVPNAAGGTVATANDVGGSQNEDLIPSQGKINVNTAPFRVLASLPIVPNSTGGIDATHTEEVANAIITYRDQAPTGHDFKSIFDLNKVTNFQQGGTANVLSNDPTDLAGDYSGAAVNSSGAGSGDNVRFDYEEQYLLMNRISNLITTHSDTYTVYIVVQGWREAGTPYPVLDWEQRSAYIMDRSSGTVRKVAIPTD